MNRSKEQLSQKRKNSTFQRLLIVIVGVLSIVIGCCLLDSQQVSHWKLLFQSERYHGPPGNKKSFVEGWYYKLVTQDERYAIAIVPGVFYANNTNGDHHSFIFFNIYGPNISEEIYFRFDTTELTSSSSDFHITVNQRNHFTLNHIHIDIDHPSQEIPTTLTGDFIFSNVIPWPSSLLFPSIMGPLQYLPFLNCYHGLLSIHHEITGQLVINNTVNIDFNQGKGYIEKDYGTAFPKSWIWMQSNHFDQSNVSLFTAIADVPIIESINLRLPMGIIAGLYVNGQLYQFCTYLLASIADLQLSDSELSFTLYNYRYSMKIYIDLSRADFSNILYGPCGDRMCKYVPEALNAEIHVKLIDRWNHSYVIFEGIGRNGGLEIVGDIIANYQLYKQMSLF